MTEDECQQIICDRKTWDIGRKNTGNNGKQATPQKDEMNWHIKQIHEKLVANKKLLASLPDVNVSDGNPMNPSN